MGRGKHPVGRVVRAVNLPSKRFVVAIDLIMPVELDGKEHGPGCMAIMDGEDVVNVRNRDDFRAEYLPVCTWREYDTGWGDDDTDG